MTSSTMRGVRRGLALLATGTIFISAAPADAQAVRYPAGAVVQPLGNDTAAELRRQLTILAQSPRSLDALIGAGRAALALGDAQAALSFFARADEVSPRNARVKAGMASAMVHMEQPQSALRVYSEAVALGAPEVEVARDRGLAYDMVGDPRRAQQDYALVLRRGDDPEVRRRMALSLAISGQREPALRMIDEQLRRNDRAALRTQAFVLALTGDAAGADRVARAQMPPQAALAMAPFFARLNALGPGQKAMAVHFGRFPSDGRPIATASADTSAHPDAVALAGGRTVAPSSSTGLRPRARPAEPLSRAQRRRPGATEQAEERIGPGLRAPVRSSRSRQQTAEPVRAAEVQTGRATPQPPPQATQPPVRQPVQQPVQPPVQQPVQQPVQPPVQQPVQQPVQRAAEQAPQSVVPATEQPVRTVALPAAQTQDPPANSARPSFDLATTLPSTQGPPVAAAAQSETAEPQPAPSEPAVPTPTPASSAESSGDSDLQEIAALVASLPREEPARPEAPPPARAARSEPPAQTAARATRTPARPRAAAAAPAHPSRHWVQIAGGADKSALPREYARIRGLAPSLLGNRAAWTTPLRLTNRLLVGPFPSADEAQEFVNQLARHNVAGFAWTSPAGQEIERLPAAR